MSLIYFLMRLKYFIWYQFWRRGTKCDCKIDWLWVRSPLEEMNIYLNVYFHFFALLSRQSAALSFSNHAMPNPELSRKWETECLNTRFPSAYPAVCGMQCEAELIFYFIFLSWSQAHNCCTYIGDMPSRHDIVKVRGLCFWEYYFIYQNLVSLGWA